MFASNLEKSPKASKKSKSGYKDYNVDFSKEKKRLEQMVQQEFKEIQEEYDHFQLLGKGSYGIVVRVRKLKYSHIRRVRRKLAEMLL